MISSMPVYTKIRSAGAPVSGSAVSYKVVPSRPVTTRLVQLEAVRFPAAHYGRDESAEHMHEYVSALWAEDWDSPEDSVYDQW